jgi:hypothetical protein
MNTSDIMCMTYPGNSQRAARIYGEAFRMGLEFISDNRVPGAVAEFGTYQGFGTLLLADLIREYAIEHDEYSDQPQRHLYVFDSFAGLPGSGEAGDTESYAVRAGAWAKGTVACPPGTQERLRGELATRLGEGTWTIIPGYYEDTLDSGTDIPELALVNLDCDLYQSTYVVLDYLMTRDLLPDGAILYFDDFNCNRANPAYGQRRVLSVMSQKFPGYELEPWHNYGWHGRAFIVHR